ncbi:MAG TPA: hypothetical protein VFW33_21865, partial [Gemmataceae bacterium]|nr:hypothetical protein [Gemmataceae bacterium]
IVVICASDAGQRSWVSHDLRKSVFAQKVIDGLRGAADQVGNGGNGDRRVSALELYDYVANGVAAWARDNRGAEQKPLLLPREQKGRDRAARMVLALAEETPAAPAAPAAEPAAPPKWLADAWDEHDKLRRTGPPPDIYAPHLWQEYREVLLRCEALARAGMGEESGPVVNLRNRLGTLKSEIGSAARLGLDPALRNSLALRRVNEPTPPAKDRDRDFLAFWNEYAVAPDSATKGLGKWAREQGKGPAGRLAFYGWLVNQVVRAAPGDVAAGLKAAHDLGQVVGGTGNDRPAEMLFLAMLARHLPDDARQKENGALVQQALRVRLLAEEAALGLDRAGDAEAEPAALSERIPAPVRDRIEGADRKRRVAEDDLFVGGASLAEARQLFDAAEKDYGQAAADFAALRHAQEVSARAHADLPYYGRWVAGTRGDRLKDLFDEAESLWDATHALDEQIAGGRTADLKRAAADVAAKLRKIKERFDGECDELLRQTVKRQAETWRRLDDVLAAPLIDDPVKRADLLALAAKLSWTLNENTGKAAGGAAPTITDDRPDEAAWRNGRLAVHAIGATRFDQDLRPADLRFDRANPPRPGLRGWEDELAHVSWQVSRVRRETRDEVLDRAKQAEAPEGKADAALAELVKAELPCRQVYGTLLPPDAPNPVALRRRWETHDLLHWLARRAIADRWWTEKEGGDTPYFASAARGYLADAGALLGERDDDAFARDRRKADGALKPLLEPTGWPKYEFVPPGDAGGAGRPIHLTGAPGLEKVNVSLSVSLPPLPNAAAPGGLPLGVVAVTRDPGGLAGAGAKPARPAREGERLAADKETVPVPLEVDKLERMKLLLGGEFRPKEPSLYHPTWYGLFRGRTFDRPADVYVHPGADSVVSELPLPPVSGISVAPDEALDRRIKKRRNILVVVLDLTGSMGEEKIKDGTIRKDAALKALDEVLDGIDKGTVVAVTTFGQDSRGGKRGDDDYEFKTPEASIQTQWKPARWRGDADRKSLIRKLSGLNPCLKSPIARAIWQSKEVFDDAEKLVDGPGAEVVKTLLVLTDGEDNRFKLDTKLPKSGRDESIRDFLKREFKRAGISMNLVLLSDNDEERDKASEQFKKLIEMDLKPQGTYYDKEIPNARELSRVLREAMRLQPNYQLLDGESAVAPLHSAEAPLSHAAAETKYRDLQMVGLPNWKYYYFRPGRYELSTWLDRDIRPTVILRPGEVLRLRLSQHAFRRALVNEEGIYKPDQSVFKKPWRLTALQDATGADNSHVIQLALEREPEAAGDAGGGAPQLIQQLPPGMVWFDVVMEKAGAPNGVLWEESRGSAAPIWKVEVPPRVVWGQVKGVTAWVSDLAPSQLSAVALFPGGTVPEELGPLNSSVETPQITWGARTMTPRVSVEAFDVVDGLGTRKPAFPCLVVRGEYDVDNPIRAVLDLPILRDKVGAE